MLRIGGLDPTYAFDPRRNMTNPLPRALIPADLVGSWRLLRTMSRDLETGDEEVYQGESGTVMYGADGRMSAVIVRGVRPWPASLDTMTDAHRLALFTSFTGYAGTYTFDGRTVSHHIDTAWNEVWTGTTQRRDVVLDGRRLTLTTHPSPRSKDGRMGVRTLVFEKIT